MTIRLAWTTARMVLVFLLMMGPKAAGQAPDMRLHKKLIATGWDHCDSQRLRENLAEMEKRPFDGVVLELVGRTAQGKPCPLAPAFSREPWQDQWFQTCVDDLRACEFTRFTDNFITLGANPGDVDWFDDAGWKNVVGHWRIAARVAQQSRL